MGVPWRPQLRLRHVAMLGLLMVPVLLYLTYIPTPEMPHPTATILTAVLLGWQTNNQSLTSQELGHNETHNVSSSEVPPVSNLPNNTVHDMSKGIAAETIYESGHTDVSLEMCPKLGRDLQVLIVITSAPSHESARMAIRQTWGHYTLRRDVSIAFMLGSTSNVSLNAQIKKEEYLYGDIIRGKFVDTYDNLTLKTISMLEWVDTYCPHASFVLKTDDDMFINVSRLLAFIKKHSPEQRAIYGRLAKKWKPIRNKKSKYYISPQQYKPPVFPDFTTGPAYLLPARLAKELYQAALNHTYFKLEDVFVTGIVANNLKIKRVHVQEFLNKRVSLTPCSVQRSISIHMVKGSEQYDLWKKQLDGLTKCK